MKKLLAFALIFALALCALGCAQEQKDTSLDDVLKKGTLVQGMDDAFPPMSFRDEADTIVGFDVDIAAEVANRMGVTLEPKPIDWNQKDTELDTGAIDVIWNGYTITQERIDKNTVTPGYMRNRQVLVVREDSEVQSLADFAGKKLALQAASSAADALDGKPDFKANIAGGEPLEYDDNMKALMDLQAGGCDGVLMDEVVANYNISVGGMAFRVIDEALAEEEYGIGVKKGYNALEAEIWKQLTAMADDGTLAKLSEKWFGKDVTIVK